MGGDNSNSNVDFDVFKTLLDTISKNRTRTRQEHKIWCPLHCVVVAVDRPNEKNYAFISIIV